MADYIDKQDAIYAVHSAIYPYFCGAEDGDELSEDEKLVLSVNDAICTSIKALPSVDSVEVEKAKGRKTCGLECLRCKQTYDYSWDTMDEISYTMYSYCPDCIRKGIQLLKSQDKEGAQE